MKEKNVFPPFSLRVAKQKILVLAHFIFLSLF